MKKICLNAALALMCAMLFSVTALAATPFGVLTPYTQPSSTQEFYNGVTFVLERKDDTEGWITRELEMMKNQYNINTVTIYGIESFDDSASNKYKDHLFKELKRLEMKIVVRIESYDATSFAFTALDAQRVVNSHSGIIEYVCAEQNRDVLAYFALNMPVDDGAVQANLGGVNSEKSKANQASYASEFVRLMREKTKSFGFDDAKMFLSIFYGWDNTYEIPSYAAAKADGYFINNYSYPKGDRIPTAEDDDNTIINADRLRISMDSYIRQYGDMPIVIECGFHTLEFNNGVRPGQTAGLVADLETKRRAMLAMLDFYKQNYKQVRGTLYFGYNLYKEEGNPPAVMDWALQYPSLENVQAEQTGLIQNACIVQDDFAAEGYAVSLLGAGDGIMLSKCPPLQQINITYKAQDKVKIGLYMGGKQKSVIDLEQSDEYTDIGLLLSVVEGYDVEIKLEQGEGLTLDKAALMRRMEAEFAQLSGTAEINADDAAGNKAYVKGLSGSENAVKYTKSRGGEAVEIAYRSASEAKLSLVIGEEVFSLTLPASQNFTAVQVKMPIAAGADFKLYADNDAFELDSLLLTGAPSVGQSISEDNSLPQAADSAPQAVPKGSSNWMWAGVIILLFAAVAGIAVIIAKRRVRKDGK